ncbi:MAG: hypothetical protein J5795_08105, partial [Lachnospiraceae bacterium]|nr:hypothetical protein [Lachnospiraceae bacterium]
YRLAFRKNRFLIHPQIPSFFIYFRAHAGTDFLLMLFRSGLRHRVSGTSAAYLSRTTHYITSRG